MPNGAGHEPMAYTPTPSVHMCGMESVVRYNSVSAAPACTSTDPSAHATRMPRCSCEEQLQRASQQRRQDRNDQQMVQQTDHASGSLPST